MSTKLYSHVFGVINNSEFSAYGVGSWDKKKSTSRFIFSKLPKEFPLTGMKDCESLHHPFLVYFGNGKVNLLNQLLSKGVVITVEGGITFPGYEGLITVNAVISSPRPGIHVISQTYHGYYEGPVDILGANSFKQDFIQNGLGVVAFSSLEYHNSEQEGMIECRSEMRLKIPIYSDVGSFSISYEILKNIQQNWNLDISIKSQSE
jgi:hypothetical protein